MYFSYYYMNIYIIMIAVKLSVRGTVVCTSPHEGRQIGKATFPIHIDQLFTLLFTNSKFFLDFQTARKTTGKIKIIYIIINKIYESNIIRINENIFI